MRNLYFLVFPTADNGADANVKYDLNLSQHSAR